MNIFTKNSLKIGTVQANGGVIGKGGSGGNGSITIGSIQTGSFEVNEE